MGMDAGDMKERMRKLARAKARAAKARIDELEAANKVLVDEQDTVVGVLRELVDAVQEGPTNRLVQAMRDARSWVKPS